MINRANGFSNFDKTFQELRHFPVKRDIITRSYQFSCGEHELYVSLFRVYKRSIRVLSAHCIVSFVACRCTMKRGARQRRRCQTSTYLAVCTSYIVRDFVKRSAGISTRRFARKLTFVRKFYQFDNIAQGWGGVFSRRVTREKMVFITRRTLLKIKIFEWGILIFENMFFRGRCEKCIRFFFFFLENICHAGRVALNASRLCFQDNRSL